jgi:anaerobic selenocysteine-containing dehydrogenase
MGVAALPGGASAEDDDEALLGVVAARSRGGADAVFAARAGTVEGPRPYGWVTERVLPEGRWRVAPAPLVAQLTELERDAAAMPASLQLVPQRRMRMMNSQLRGVAARGGRVETVDLVMHADDAAARGITDGAPVRLRSHLTDEVIDAVAAVGDRVRPGTVSLPHGWSDVNVCALTTARSEVDPLTGMVLQSGIPVEVSCR